MEIWTLYEFSYQGGLNMSQKYNHKRSTANSLSNFSVQLNPSDLFFQIIPALKYSNNS